MNTVIAIAVIAVGVAMILVTESSAACAFLRENFPAPAFWMLLLPIVGYQLLAATPVFLVASFIRQSRRAWLRTTGGVITLFGIVALTFLNALFGWVIITWGMATDWRYTF